MTVGGLTMGSRVLGFTRDILTAAFLGAGPVADAFFVALKLPNFFRRVTAEGAFSVSFVPLFAGELETKGKEEAKKFAQEAQAVMLMVLVPFTILMIAAMPWVLYVIAPGFVDTPERYDLAVEMARITFPYILLMSLTALLGGVLNSFDRFAPFAAAPILFNATLILALLFLSPLMQTEGHALAVGVAVAGILQFGFLWWFCRKIKFSLKIQKPSLTPRIKRLFKLMGPGVIGAGAMQINLFIDMILASLLPVGAVSFLYYADRLYQLPLGVIGIAIGTALLPMLSRAVKSDQNGEVKTLFSRAFDSGLVLAMPATAALIFIPETLMAVLFQRGEFSASDSAASAAALRAYAIGVPAYVLVKVFSTAYFARENTATPVKFAIICAVINTILAIILLQPLAHVGIALATGITAWVNMALLGWGLHKRGHLDIALDSVKRLAMIFLSAAVMTVFLISFQDNLVIGSVWMQIGGLAVLVGSGAVIYFAMLYFTGIFTRKQVKDLFPKRKKQATIKDVREQDEREE